MIAVADDNAGAEIHAAHDLGGGSDALHRGLALGFDQNGLGGDAVAAR